VSGLLGSTNDSTDLQNSSEFYPQNLRRQLVLISRVGRKLPTKQKTMQSELQGHKAIDRWLENREKLLNPQAISDIIEGGLDGDA
jgi:hypothetical protein